MKDYCVYILSNSAATLYIGVTGNLDQRIFDHDTKRDPESFASRYNLDRLISWKSIQLQLKPSPGKNN